MKKFTATYKTEIVTTKKNIDPEGASCIEFIRNCTDTALILGTVTLNSDNPNFSIINRPDVVIKQNILVEFLESDTTTQRIEVVKTIYEEN